MLDILSLLVCIYCAPKESLELFPLQVTESSGSSESSGDVRIHQGCLYCTSCSRYYIIRDEILYLCQDNLREKEEELDFLQEWQSDLPEKIIFESKPWNLTTN
jgi:uncharacterized protein YbaR (Trm112 family)